MYFHHSTKQIILSMAMLLFRFYIDLLLCLILFSLSIKVLTRHTTLMEQNTLKNVNSCQNTKIYSYLVTSGG
jgi:hypothetical protein